MLLSWGFLQNKKSFTWKIAYVMFLHKCRVLVPWWRHQMETFSALLALFAGNLPVNGEFPSQRPVARRFDVCLDLLLNKRLSKQSWAGDLRRYHAHCDVIVITSNALDKLDNIQHRAIRLYLDVNQFAPNKPINADMDWQNSKTRRHVNMLRLWNSLLGM